MREQEPVYATETPKAKKQEAIRIGDHAIPVDVVNRIIQLRRSTYTKGSIARNITAQVGSRRLAKQYVNLVLAHKDRLSEKLANKGYDTARAYRGISGWLLWASLGITVTTGFAVYNGLTYIGIQPAGEYQKYYMVFLMVALLYITIAVLGIVYLIQLFRKKRSAKTFAILVLSLTVITAIADVAAASALLEALGENLPDNIYESVSRAVGAALVWIPYFLVSKRVQATLTR